jgi:hypothetical protein
MILRGRAGRHPAGAARNVMVDDAAKKRSHRMLDWITLS